MEVVVSGIPAGVKHSGGSLTFGPDGNLYMGVGEAENSLAAGQHLRLEGSVLRFTPDGQIPADNPFETSPVYAYGFRNPYGIAFHPLNGFLYLAENGAVCCDRIFRVEPGRFHGWPFYGKGTGELVLMLQDPQVIAPLIESGPRTYAPTQLLAYGGDRYGEEFKGNLFFGSFVEGSIHSLTLTDGGYSVASDEIIFQFDSLDPITAITATPDGYIYFATAAGIFRINNITN